MTQFEFVSVAISLVLALAVTDAVRALPAAVRSPARYWPHVGWLLTMLLLIVFTWWTIWFQREVSWTALRFAYILFCPALISILTSLLTHSDPSSIASFREHFHLNRRAFFALLLVVCVNASFTAWVTGRVPIGTLLPIQFATLPGAVLAIAGLNARTDRAHAILAVLALVIVFLALALLATPEFPVEAA